MARGRCMFENPKRSKLKCSLTSRRGRRLNNLSDSLSFSLRSFFVFAKNAVNESFVAPLMSLLDIYQEKLWIPRVRLTLCHFFTCVLGNLFACTPSCLRQLSLNSLLNFCKYEVFYALKICRRFLCTFSV